MNEEAEAVGNLGAQGGDSSRIIVGVDGSGSSRSALRRAVTLARSLQSSLVAITVWEVPEYWSMHEDTGRLALENATRAAAAASEDVFDGDPPEWFSSIVTEGSAARTLIEQSADASMLVVGSRGLGGFSGLLLGSVSAECSRYAECPVLIVRGRRRETEPTTDRRDETQ
ncbi:universal stress protein [Paramicrobacterium fandaimingii]|uniref:universal stress protein n=1 Tax=Paramicrobacterium fandaimingii TaxID=2708079 RepID=UPI00141DC10F|nr:universal stress protein [Microbacterium fandaimingii]